MNTGSESNDLDREVDESMRMFEKSQVGPSPTISIIKPSRVMLVLDGSPQDDAGVDAAVYLREQFNTETVVLDARDSQDGDAKANAGQSEMAIARATEITGARPIERKQGESYEAILAALQQHSVDLVIVPCPYGRPLEKVGADSAGTVIDVMLSRCPKAILVIRREDQLLRECVHHVSMVVAGECDLEYRAAAWALGLALKPAEVNLNLVIEKEQFENIRSILEAMQPNTKLNPEQFSDALARSHHSLHGAMAKTASSLGLTYHLRPIAGEIAPPNPLQESSKLLLVIPLEVDDRFEQGFVHDRIRRSPHPVLVVPGHVPQ